MPTVQEKIQVQARASISKDGLYRPLLSRQWSERLLLPFVMCSPSTADALKDDPTIRRCAGFARREGFGGILVLNLFDFRAAKIEDLVKAEKRCSEGNDKVLEHVVTESIKSNLPIVCAWGSIIKKVDHMRGKWFRDMALIRSARLVCLGKTKDGYPRHPLYVPNNQKFESYP
jgi:hypothetical protein